MPNSEASTILRASPSVTTALTRVGTGQICAADFARAVFSLHGEYAGGRAQALQLADTPSRKTAQQWLAEVQVLFDPLRIQSFAKDENARKNPPELHGKLLIIGLGLLEPDLRKQLEQTGTFEALVKEMQEPLLEILTKQGRILYQGVFDSVPNWPDDPLFQPNEDLLGRSAFAQYLAERIQAVPEDAGAYCMHIFGPWGAGKSSLLNFLRRELELKNGAKNKWFVVEFNAWRHQHIQPPWWTLMESVFRQTRAELSLSDRLQEYWWRFNTGRLHYILGAVVVAWALVFFVPQLIDVIPAGAEGLKFLADNAENLSKIVALATTVWAGIFAFNRSLLFGAAEAAKRYTELTHDPTSEIKKRFMGLIQKLKPARVAVLIDDLDRCQSRFVVDLLEGVQTLFRDASVIFVVAADRHWLNACYEDVYDRFSSQIRVPGKPLGALFLEKAFRFSTSMPGLSQEHRESYWQHLLRLAPKGQSDADDARAQAMKNVKDARSEGELQSLIELSRDRPFLERRAIQELAVVRLAAPDVHERLEHTLKSYGSLLEPNPRAMKLLVNSYSANRALAILSDIEIDLEQLALWTILCARWPRLADYLAEHPGAAGSLPEDLRALSGDQNLKLLLEGESGRSPLTIETLRKCARIRS